MNSTRTIAAELFSDCGSGHGLGLSLGEAHESAIKEAEGIEAIEKAE